MENPHTIALIANPQKTFDSKKCSRCGKGPHPRSTCPAKDVTCHRCQKKGHYSSQCFSKRVAEVAIQQEGDRYQQEEDLDTVYLNIIGSGPHIKVVEHPH